MEVAPLGFEPGPQLPLAQKVKTGTLGHAAPNQLNGQSCVEVFFSAIHTVWTLWSCIYQEFKDRFEENILNEYFKTISHCFHVYSLSGFI